MKLRAPVLILLALSVLTLFSLWFFRSKPSIPIASEPPPEPVLHADDEASYDVEVLVTQSQGSAAPTPVLKLQGTLKQGVQPNDEYVSTWSAISRLEILGQEAAASIEDLLLKPVLSSYVMEKRSYQHFLKDELSPQLQMLETNLLQKMLLPPDLPVAAAAPSERREEDEVGGYDVRYTRRDEADGIHLERRWLRYVPDYIAIDEQRHTLNYRLSTDGRLLSVSGAIALNYRVAQPTTYTSQFTIRLKEAAVAAPITLVKSELKRVDLSADNSAANSDENYQLTLKNLDQLTEDSPPREAYSIFSQLKQQIIAQPERGQELARRILSQTARDASTKRRHTILFGALAQSQSPRHAELLTDLAEQCPDNFCRVQALVGVSDHKFPSEAIGSRILELATKSRDDEIASTALLAAGSIGHKLSNGLPQLSAVLINELNNPARASIEGAIIGAMGNHGSSEYFEVLSTKLEAKKARTRAAAAYGLRFLPQADAALLRVFEKESEHSVLFEAYKALDYRDLSASAYLNLAQKSASYNNLELQQAAARTLIHAYQVNPDKLAAAVQALQSSTSFPDVRAYIEAELKSPTP